MFPELPQNLSDLSDDELAAKLAEFKAVAEKVVAGDEETFAALGSDTAEVSEAIDAAAAEKLRLDAEMSRRAADDEAFQAKVAEAKTAFGIGDEPEADEPVDADPGDEDPSAEAEAETVEETREPVTAAAKPARRPLPAARGRQRPKATEPDGTGLLASSQVYPSAEPGERLNGRRFAEVLQDMLKRNAVQPGVKVIVASVTYPYPAERLLDRDLGENARKIAPVSEAMLMNTPDAITASGGLCAPLTPIYDLPDVEVATRPVRDALANFQASRGGVIAPVNPTITDYADAVGHVTAAEDEAGGTYGVKSSMRIECPDFNSVEVDAIYSYIEAGNLTAKAYPELMSRIDTLVNANFARLADGFLLNQIKAGSIAVTDVNTTTTAGAMWKLIEYLHVAAAGFRSAHRMSEAARLRVIFPEWLLDLLVVDAARNGNDSDRFKTKGRIEEILANAGIAISYTKDGPSTGTAQVFAAQTAGNLLGFPSAVQFPMYPDGSWLHLDSGQLNLGIIRDSTLTSTNDFQVFAETWENAVLVGVQSQWHTATLAPNGTNSAPKDFSASTNF